MPAPISSGGVALLAPTGNDVGFADKCAVNGALLLSGAGIAETSVVRKHLFAVQGGWLADAAYAA